jgi:hypothetical protein
MLSLNYITRSYSIAMGVDYGFVFLSNISICDTGLDQYLVPQHVTFFNALFSGTCSFGPAVIRREWKPSDKETGCYRSALFLSWYLVKPPIFARRLSVGLLPL